MMSSTAIRQSFLDFFRSKQHAIVPSAPIVVKDDPTLMFTNAGMNQFKDYFLGNKKSPDPRVADTQKCLRVSGKHNDLEEVGVDTYHHTMFEMLGNWSFGDPQNPGAGYFKDEAIAWSWELLTGVYKIDKDRLYVTVFEGDDSEGLPRDEEAAASWAKWISPDRIVLGNKKDNFWEMGDTGPCGPCTEIHVDCRPDEERKAVDGKTLINRDHPQVIEIWNNVFIQFNRLKDGRLEQLPARHVDTGMGLERLVRVLQGKQSNYDTDVFSGTIEAIGKKVNRTYRGGDDKESIAFRVIADHIRAICFTIADGQLPSNTGAGYVIRRILRRAVRYYYSSLGYKQPLLFELVQVLGRQFEHVFPGLIKQAAFVERVVREEEEAFLRTLEKGLKRLDDLVAQGNISGKNAFELYDTYGFPLDLTRLIAQEHRISVDEAGFQAEMQQQKNRSRAATTIDAGDWIVLKEGSNAFVGYDSLETKSTILKYRKVTTKGKEVFQVVLDTTPFYAESGGQVGDRGWIGNFPVVDTRKDNDLIIHFTEFFPDEVPASIDARVDSHTRKRTAMHHTATHLVHAALRKVLGTHVTQKGSLVNEHHLRFDFSHFAKMTAEEMAAVEKLVNEKIRENIPVVIRQMKKEEALQLGAMALFGEKYGDMVRVVIIDPAYSVELCGGTHVTATGELGIFKLTTETAVAAGVRRIEAVCGENAEEYYNGQLQLLAEVKGLLKQPKDLLKAVESLQAENATLKKHVESMEARQLVGIRNELLTKDEIVNGVNFIGDIVEVTNAEALKKLCTDLRNHVRDHVAVLGVNIDGKPFIAVGISETVAAARNLDANKIIKEIVAPLIKGGGGGQKTLATAGGQQVSGLAEAIRAVKQLL